MRVWFVRLFRSLNRGSKRLRLPVLVRMVSKYICAPFASLLHIVAHKSLIADSRLGSHTHMYFVVCCFCFVVVLLFGVVCRCFCVAFAVASAWLPAVAAAVHGMHSGAYPARFRCRFPMQDRCMIDA